MNIQRTVLALALTTNTVSKRMYGGWRGVYRLAVAATRKHQYDWRRRGVA